MFGIVAEEGDIQKLKKYGMENRVQEFNVSSATVELAAEALHCESFMLNMEIEWENN